jgi:hypothetical protein
MPANMRKTTMTGRWARAAVVAGAFTLAGTVAACDDFLAADNPAAVPVDRLNDTSLVDLMHNSTIAGLQGSAHFWYAWLGATFTDELRNTHPFIDEVLFDQRRVAVDNSYNNVFTYGPIQRARWLADSVAGRIRTIYGDSATRDGRLARIYAISGYQLVRLAEGWCEVPISTSEQLYTAPIPSEQLFRLAEQRFDSALKVAAASRAANQGGTTSLRNRWTLAADSIRNLANLGMARAALGRNDLTKAAQYARLVAPIGTATNWEWRIFYNANTALGLTNTFADRLSGGAGSISGAISNTPFLNLDDPRVPHPRDANGNPLAEGTQLGNFVVPNSGLVFSTYNGTVAGAEYSLEASMRFASILEAQYIIAEAEGPTPENIAFIESRRLAFPSNTATTPTTVANYMTNLIDQRGRDFFLAGNRIGDLRRWEKYRGITTVTTPAGRTYGWPTGSYYGSATVTFGNVKCWPINAAEIINNPNVPKPYSPPQGP